MSTQPAHCCQSSVIRRAGALAPPNRLEQLTTVRLSGILTTAFPMNENGKLKLLMGYVSDISRQKWAESVQTRNATAATLARRRQEEYEAVLSVLLAVWRTGTDIQIPGSSTRQVTRCETHSLQSLSSRTGLRAACRGLTTHHYLLRHTETLSKTTWLLRILFLLAPRIRSE